MIICKIILYIIVLTLIKNKFISSESCVSIFTQIIFWISVSDQLINKTQESHLKGYLA